MNKNQLITECKPPVFKFSDIGRRAVEMDFSGGRLTTDGGLLLFREVNKDLNMFERLAKCFIDKRDQRYTEHKVSTILAQRILGDIAGYEDVNDHDTLRNDPLFALACEQTDLLGDDRRRKKDKGLALAGKSTLNRFELSAHALDDRTKKIQAQPEKIEDLLLQLGVECMDGGVGYFVVDVDSTQSTIYGNQEGRFFNSFHGDYCYMPLIGLCGDIPLYTKLRPANRDAFIGTLEAIEKIIPCIRKQHGNRLPIIIRADSGFCRNEILAFCERLKNAYYVIGFAKNERLAEMIEPAFWDTAAILDEQAVQDAKNAGATVPPKVEGTARTFKEMRYKTNTSWSCERRVIGKAEITNGDHNPRYIVTNITGDEEWAKGKAEFADGAALYEKFYCARGNAENRIKEYQLDLFADRTSTAYLASNQLRLWMSAFAYTLVGRLRAVALKNTELANATVGTIRLKLVKIAAQVSVSVRRVYTQFCSGCPMQEVFAQAYARFQAHMQVRAHTRLLAQSG
jgi:hypothetical protein